MLATEIPSYVGWLIPLLVIGIVIQFFWSSLMSWLLYVVSKKDRNVEGMEKRLHDLAAKLVDEKFLAMARSVGDHVKAFNRVIDEVKDRLREREEQLREVEGDGRALEVRLMEKLSEQHERITEKIAALERVVMTREDLKAVLREMRQ